MFLKTNALGALLILFVSFRAVAAEDLVIDNFEGGGTTWTCDNASAIKTDSSTAAKSGTGGMLWRFKPDGVNQYGNSIEARFDRTVLGGKKFLVMDVFANGALRGRIGCQLLNGEAETNMDDIHTRALEGQWVTVSLPIPEEALEVDGVRLFFDGSAYLPTEPFECFIDNVGSPKARPHRRPPARWNQSARKRRLSAHCHSYNRCRCGYDRRPNRFQSGLIPTRPRCTIPSGAEARLMEPSGRTFNRRSSRNLPNLE